jgi:hypothetical protein
VDNEVKIPIITTADTSGAQKQAAALGQVGQAAKQAAAATQPLGKATESAGEAAKESGKKWEFLGQKKAEVRRLVRELGQEFPIAAQAIRAAMNPVAAVMLAAITIFAKAKEAIDEWNASMDEASKRAANPDFQTGLAAKKTALDEARTSSLSFVESLKAIGTGQDDYIKKIDQTISKIHEYIAAQAEINSAAEAKQIEDVNLAEKLGKISPQQGIISRAAIRERFAKQNANLKTEGENAELAAKQAELDHSLMAAPGLTANALAKKNTADALQARLKAAQASLPDAQKKLEEDRETANKLGDEYHNLLARERIRSPEEADNEEVGRAARKSRGQYESARAAQDRQAKLVAQYKEDAEKIPGLLPGALSAQSISAAQATANENRIVSLTGEVATQRQVLPIRQSARSIATGYQSATAQAQEAEALMETPLGQNILRAGQISSAIAGGSRKRTDLTPDENAFLSSMDIGFTGQARGDNKRALQSFANANDPSRFMYLYERMAAVQMEQSDKTTADAIAGGREVSSQSKQALIEHAKSLNGSVQTLQQAVQFMRTTLSTVEGQQRVIQQIQQRMEELNRNITNGESRARNYALNP